MRPWRCKGREILKKRYWRRQLSVTLGPGSGAGAGYTPPHLEYIPPAAPDLSGGPREEGALFHRVEKDHFGKERLLLGCSDPSGLPAADAKQTGP